MKLRNFEEFIIDGNGLLRRGNVIPIHSPGAGNDGLTASADYAVKNLGYCHLQIGHKEIRIRIRPSALCSLTYVELCYFVADHGSRQFVIFEYNDTTDDWDTRIFGGLTAFLSYAASSLESANTCASFASRRTPLKMADLQVDGPFRVAIDYWLDTKGEYDPSTFKEIKEHVLSAKYTWVELHRDSNELIIEGAGAGLPKFAYQTLHRAVGDRLKGHPDYLYSNFCHRAYVEALEQWAPLIELVEAEANWPGYGVMRRQYHRLLLPFVSPTKQSQILSATMDGCTMICDDKVA